MLYLYGPKIGCLRPKTALTRKNLQDSPKYIRKRESQGKKSLPRLLEVRWSITSPSEMVAINTMKEVETIGPRDLYKYFTSQREEGETLSHTHSAQHTYHHAR